MGNELFCVLDSYEFFGEFFHSEDSYETRFPGRITYSPEGGLILHYNIADADIKFEYDHLIGVLDNGKKCTIIGPFNFRKSGLRLGGLTTRYGKHHIRYLVVGAFLEESAKFSYASFSINHMQEFFNDIDNLGFVPYQEEPLIRVCDNEWSLTVTNRASFYDVTRQLKNLIRVEGENAKNIVYEALERLDEFSFSEQVYLRNTIEVVFEYESENQSIESMLSVMQAISSIFSMLVGTPSFPEKIILGDNHSSEKLDIISDVALESGTVSLAKNKISHHQIPIGIKDMDFEEVLKKWISFRDKYQVISTVFDYETNYRTLHEAHCDIVLYATNLEAISYEAGKNKIKYEYPVRNYSSPKLIGFFETLTSKAGCASIGEAISELRNEIAHVGKNKKIMGKLKIRDYVDFGQGMKLVIVSYLFEKLGISMDKIHRYQDRFL